MAKRAIVWTETAAKQRREIFIYWTKRNGSTAYAEKLLKLIAKHSKIIQKNPEIFKYADFLDNRFSAMGHLSIFYKIREKDIIITAFWVNRQTQKSY